MRAQRYESGTLFCAEMRYYMDDSMHPQKPKTTVDKTSLVIGFFFFFLLSQGLVRYVITAVLNSNRQFELKKRKKQESELSAQEGILFQKTLVLICLSLILLFPGAYSSLTVARSVYA